MCTAVSYRTDHHYFGRNLDLEYCLGETVTFTPRNFPLRFRHIPHLAHHHSIIGMAQVVQQYPLYYDATNEKGLSMAALNFPGFAKYRAAIPNRLNVTPFEIIPWILGSCATVREAKLLLERTSILNEPFSEAYPLSPLHWILADREECLTLEPCSDGLRISYNPVGILTNNPPFDYHMLKLSEFLNLSRLSPANRFAPGLKLESWSRGMGAIGLPGDLSSSSRFIRGAFAKWNSRCNPTEESSVSQFFHILAAVEQQRGLAQIHPGLFELTQYSSCCNTDKGIYYYRTYDNSQITAVDMHREDQEGCRLITWPLIRTQQIHRQNDPDHTASNPESSPSTPNFRTPN